jgi:hypothetical protein
MTTRAEAKAFFAALRTSETADDDVKALAEALWTQSEHVGESTLAEKWTALVATFQQSDDAITLADMQDLISFLELHYDTRTLAQQNAIKTRARAFAQSQTAAPEVAAAMEQALRTHAAWGYTEAEMFALLDAFTARAHDTFTEAEVAFWRDWLIAHQGSLT